MITLMMNKKNIYKFRRIKEKKEKWHKLNLDEKKQLTKYKKKVKKAMHDNLDDEQKEHLKIEDNKKEKGKAW